MFRIQSLSNIVFLISIYTMFISCAMQSSTIHINKDCTYSVSFADLLETPGKYDQSSICVEGYLVIEFEHRALYLSAKDVDKKAYQRAIWLSFENASKELLEKMHELKNHYVRIIGTFEANLHGHGSLFSSEIERIKRLEKGKERGHTLNRE